MGANLITLVSIGLVSSFCTLCFVPLFSFLATKIGLLDVPDGKIKKHANPVPYLGGVAVFCGFVCGLIFFFPLFNDTAFFLLFGTMPFLILGLIDDISPLKPYKKFLGQCIIALCLLYASTYIKDQFFQTYWYMPLFVLWVLTVVNALNLIDVMDGLATTTAIGATTSFLAIAIMQHNSEIMIPLVALTGALIAFLWYNQPPAHMYLGDAGALWIGSFLAVVPVFLNWSSYSAFGWLTPIFILSIPLLEICSLIVIRSYKKIPFYLGSPHHFCHYLRANGWSKRLILLYVASISIIINVVACLYVQGIISLTTLCTVSVIMLSIWLSFLIYKP